MNENSDSLKENELPSIDMSDIPTNCCPRFHPEGWDDRDLRFRDKLFVKVKTRSLLYMPLNIGSVFKKTLEAIETEKAQDPHQFIVLSRDLSLWAAEHFFSVTKNVPGQEMVPLSGNYHTKVFQGPFKDAGKWRKELSQMANDSGGVPDDRFLFYTTCPRCAKHYGTNYVVGLAATSQVA